MATSVSALNVDKVDGYVYRNGVWNYIVSLTKSSGSGQNTGTWYQISPSNSARNIVSLTNTSGRASGSTSGY